MASAVDLRWPRWLKQSTAQAYANCSKDCMDRWIKYGYITPKDIPMESKPRIDREEIDKLMKGKDNQTLKDLSADAKVDKFLEMPE